MDGYQYEAGVLAGTIFADTPSDPSLTIGGSVDNDTGFAWSGYQIRIFMDRPFTLSNVGVGPVPGDWTFTTTGPAPGGSPTYYSGTQYEAEIHYAGGTPVPVGGELDFSYKLTFVGSTQYGFTTEMTPVPEPSILALGAFAMAGLCAIKRARQSSSAKQ
jgi:hypothetical protein